MKLFYCDETNLEKRAGDYLIYGGVIIDGSIAKNFSLEIDDIRNRHGVPRDYRLKFNPGPEGFSHEDFINLKQEIIEASVRFGVKLLVYVILHDIAKDTDNARRNGINSVCYHFDSILNNSNDSGLVLIDRFNDEGNIIDGHLRDKFTIGVEGMPYSSEMRLANITGFHYSAVGQSHFPSVVDIVLGSLRFAINAHTRNQSKNIVSAEKILELLSPLFWRRDAGESIPEFGFHFSPKVIKVPKFMKSYCDLKKFLDDNGVLTMQEISSQRNY